MRRRLIAAATGFVLVSATISVASTAGAVQFEKQYRSDLTVCVATSTPAEVQVTRDYYWAQVEQYELLEARLRAAHPEFQEQYTQFDALIGAGQVMPGNNAGVFSPGVSVIFNSGKYNLYEAQFFAVRATQTYRDLVQLAETGFPVEMEYAVDWTKQQFDDYEGSGTPVVPIGGEFTFSETSFLTIPAYQQLTAGLPKGLFVVGAGSAPNVQTMLEPHKEALAELKRQYDAVVSTTALFRAAQNCEDFILTGAVVPTTTVTPTVTVTATPDTVTVTPAPVTTTAPVGTVVVTPAPTTITTPGGTTTVTSATATTTVTAPQVTVTTTPEPVTTTVSAPGETTTLTTTPAPVTTTLTAPVVTTTVTPAPVTTTAPGSTLTVTPGPVTITAEPGTETVTPDPVTTTVTAPTVTETVTPTTTQTPPDDGGTPGDGGNNLGLVAAIVAVLAALGGIAAFLANNMGLFAGFF
ncbi:hypothetical protein [Corynebacterium gallinarum]|uniref:Uncharacterized protein n=1 Tax=Corynebacterium gallinarum TaxID=2762214 RepID=A0A8I0HR07_9CORY|nr:hypothetical protein [Corynebacterium gallinarum]MBD8030907.1 hypothetical protein [Corynebacterium gallinarum]